MSETGYLNVAEIFGENVFNDAVMQERLPKKVYKKLKEVIQEGRELDLETADVVAHEMKEWAIEKEMCIRDRCRKISQKNLRTMMSKSPESKE